MTWPVRTMSLKSAPSDRMVPDTCGPTCTVRIASSVPVACTYSVTSPCDTVALTICGGSTVLREL